MKILIINVKSYVLLTLVDSLKIVSINILKAAKTRIKKLGNVKIKAACAHLFPLVCTEHGSGKNIQLLID